LLKNFKLIPIYFLQKYSQCVITSIERNKQILTRIAILFFYYFYYFSIVVLVAPNNFVIQNNYQNIVFISYLSLRFVSFSSFHLALRCQIDLLSKCAGQFFLFEITNSGYRRDRHD